MQGGWGVAPPFRLPQTVGEGKRIGRTGPFGMTSSEGEHLVEDSTLLGNATQLSETGETTQGDEVASTQGEPTATLVEQIKTS